MLDGQEARPYGYHGLACIIVVPWDTQFSPIDVRTLAARRPAPAVVNEPPPPAVIANRPPPPAAMNRPPTPSPATADLSSGEEVHRSERQADLRLGTSQAISICALSRITALDAAEGGWKSAWYVITHGKVLRPCDVDRWLAQMVPNTGGQTVLTPLSQCRALQPRQRRRLAYHRRPRPAPGRTRAPPRPRGGG
jgi:hypothetical protein